MCPMRISSKTLSRVSVSDLREAASALRLLLVSALALDHLHPPTPDLQALEAAKTTISTVAK